MATCKIENNTSRIIKLFATESFPNGIPLVPGENNVPKRYMEEMRERTRPEVVLPTGKKRPRGYPGRESLARLLEPVRIVTSQGVHRGPQITIYEDAQASPEEGPPPPLDLDKYNESTAISLIKVTKDKKALKRWAEDRRPAVATAAVERLQAS